MSNQSISSPIDLLSACGHIGYQWDLIEDKIIWFGSWKSLFGESCKKAPKNSKELSSYVFKKDQYLIFNDTLPSFDREYRLCIEDNAPIWVHENGTTNFENGIAIRQQGILNVIKEHNEEENNNFKSNDIDQLTGLPNRNCMKDIIDSILQHPREDRNKTAYISIGVDNLTLINEGLGTKSGDELLCAVSDRLREIIPPRAIICRSSGDAFGLLLPGLAKEIRILPETILKSFHDHSILINKTKIHVSVCIGCLPFKEINDSKASDVMIHAEQALNEARDIGNGNITTYDSAKLREKKHKTIINIVERVRQALEDHTVQLAFQPIIDANTRETILYECLARVFYDDGTPIPAGEFIPIIEQMGMAPEFDKYILRLAFKELERSPNLRLTANISGISAALPSWPDFVKSLLANRPDISERLIIEITETAAVLDIAKMKNLISSLREMGSEVALDDFGAGSTSIRHLRELDFAVMKIDCELIFGITENQEQQHLVKVLISMAQGLGLRTIAEGIENEETSVWLRDAGIDLLQGFYHGRPSFDRPWLDEGETKNIKTNVPCSELPSSCV